MNSVEPYTVPCKSSFWYNFGRYLLIVLAITTIILDTHKMVTEYDKTDIYLTSSKLDIVTFYSSSIITHFVGLGAAVEHEIWLTVLCRLASALIYQINLSSKSNQVPQDPKKLEKIVRKKIAKNPDLLRSKMRKKINWIQFIRNFLMTF